VASLSLGEESSELIPGKKEFFLQAESFSGIISYLMGYNSLSFSLRVEGMILISRFPADPNSHPTDD
jgi:hypothetical protein